MLIPNGDGPPPRNNHASCSLNEFLYIHGGHDGENWLDDFYELDTKKLTWKKILTNQHKPKARACHSLSRITRKLFLYGGYDGKDSFSDIEIFDTDSQLWTCVKTVGKITPSPRNAHTATVINKKIYIFGGHYQNYHLNDLYIYDPNKNEWEKPKLKGEIPQWVRGHSASFIFNKIYFFGGYDGNTRNNDIYRLTLDDLSFKRIKSNRENITPRQRHSANIINNFKILFFGGYEGARWLNNVDILNISKLEENLFLEESGVSLKLNFKNLINKEDYSDITFIFDDKKIFAHKNILYARVEYFRNMFSDYMIEKTSNVIEINSFDYDIYLSFLEFIYSSNISNKDFDTVFKLFELADFYTYDCLKKFCEDLLCFMIEETNVIKVLILAYKCNSHLLKNMAVDFIVKNKRDVIKCNEISYLVDFPALMIKIMENLN